MAQSKIQWTDYTWNIARGCTKVDADCKFCYMYRQSLNAKRYKPDQVVRTKTVFNLPLRIKEPSKIFTSSLTDFFHKDIDAYRAEAWEIIRKCPQHTFQILTKRPERILECLPEDWGDGYNNVWLGTSVGSPKSLHRAEKLTKVPAKVRYLSIEPLWQRFDKVGLYNRLKPYSTSEQKRLETQIHWVIVGGESGNENGKYRYRPCDLDWIEDIVDTCKMAGTKVFVKQLGTYLAKRYCLSDRHGGNLEEFTESLQIREFPNI